MNLKIQSHESFVTARTQKRPRSLRLRGFSCLCALSVGAGALSIAADEPGKARERPQNATQESATGAVGKNTSAQPAAAALPPLPAGVSELKFSDFFAQPAGPRGLTLTEKLRRLDGKRVRLLGYMVQEEKPTPGVFILSPYPAQIHDHDNALADDLPPSVVHVSVPTGHDQPVPHSSRLLLLTGTLSVGNRTEADGRISLVRLAADAPEAAAEENIVPKQSAVKQETQETNSSTKSAKHE